MKSPNYLYDKGFPIYLITIKTHKGFPRSVPQETSQSNTFGKCYILDQPTFSILRYTLDH